MENSKPTSYKKFRAALRSLSPDSRHVFKHQMPVLDSKNWRQGLGLLSDLSYYDSRQMTPLWFYLMRSENRRDPLVVACILGLTASEIVGRFGNLRIEVVDLIEWLLDNDMLQLVDDEDEMGEDGIDSKVLFVEFGGAPAPLH